MNENFKQNLINAVLGKLSSNTKYSPEIEQYLTTVSPEQRQGVANGLNFGNKDILANQQRLGINIPQGEEQIALARQGQFNLPTEGAIRQGGLINGYNQGYNLNYDNPTNQISTRIGQALGTIKRGFDSPLGRAAATYGVAKLLGEDDPIKQAIIAGAMRNDKQNASNLYKQQLKSMGVDVDGAGEVTSDAFKNLVSAYNAGSKTMTLQELANLGNIQAQNAITNGANPYTAVNTSISRDLLNNVGALNEARINKLKKDLEYIDTKIANGTASIAERQRANNIRAALVQSQIGVNKAREEQIRQKMNESNNKDKDPLGIL